MIDPFEKETNKCVGDLSTHVKYNALLCMVQNAQNFFVQIYKVSGKKSIAFNRIFSKDSC